MKKNIFSFLSLLLFSMNGFAQCEIQNRVAPDETMLYFMEPVNFYWTKAKSLKGNLVTDKENYFLALQPIPFPSKDEGKKLKSDAEMTLSNGKVYRLSHFDTHYLENDSIMELLYLIDERDLEDVLNYEATVIQLNMKGDEGIRKYVLKLHKKALQEQLNCFYEMKKKKD